MSGEGVVEPSECILLFPDVRGETRSRVQALAQGGGPTARGTQRNIKVLRKKTDGAVAELSPKLTDPIQPDDVIYVRESLF